MATFVLTEAGDLFPTGAEDTSGQDVIFGLGGDDDISAGDNIDNVEGGAGDDTLRGEAGGDVLLGGLDRDLLYGGEGGDVLDCGSGGDTAYGGDGDDQIGGGASDTGADRLFGDGGHDVINGNGGADRLFGGAGDDTLDGDEDNDTLTAGAGQDRLIVGEGFDLAFGGAGDDLFEVQSGQTGSLDGGDGRDRILAGINTILAGYSLTGIEVLEVFTGIPSILNAQATAAQFQSFTGIIDTWAFGDFTFLGITDGGTTDFGARIAAGMKLQVVLQSDAGNSVTLGDGDDIGTGRGGADSFFGGAGSDRLSGGAGDDYLDGGTGNDTLNGGQGANTIVFDSAGDVYENEGSSGDLGLTALSTFVMPRFLRALTYTGTGNATLTGNEGFNADGSNTITAGAGNDTVYGGFGIFSGFDTLIGLGGNDRLFGEDGSDTLEGGAGRDRLFGGNQADRLTGGAGGDTLDGGDGADVFVLLAVTDSGPTLAGRDRIAGFVSGSDRIDLSAIDAVAGTPGDDAFRLDTDGILAAGEIRQVVSGADLVLEINTDADAAVEMRIALLMSAAVTEVEFIL